MPVTNDSDDEDSNEEPTITPGLVNKQWKLTNQEISLILQGLVINEENTPLNDKTAPPQHLIYEGHYLSIKNISKGHVVYWCKYAQKSECNVVIKKFKTDNSIEVMSTKTHLDGCLQKTHGYVMPTTINKIVALVKLRIRNRIVRYIRRGIEEQGGVAELIRYLNGTKFRDQNLSMGTHSVINKISREWRQLVPYESEKTILRGASPTKVNHGTSVIIAMQLVQELVNVAMVD